MADDKILWTPMANMIVEDTWGGPKRTPDNSLGKDAFLQLLITQMKYQDPLNPMDDRDFLGQMAQFTALEQMQNLNATFAKSQAYAMIGKTVEAIYRNPITGDFEEVYGFVDAVTTKNGEVFLMVNGREVPLSSVSIVGDDYLTALQLNDILNNVTNTRAQAYVGKHIQALLTNDMGDVTEYVEGVVDYVKHVTVDGKTMSILVVGDKEVLPQEVASVSNDPFLIGRQLSIGGTMRTINGVNIVAGKAQLTFAGGGSAVPIDKINYVMEALVFVGREMNHRDISGTVKSVGISAAGIPVFNIELANGETRQVDYLDYLDARGK